MTTVSIPGVCRKALISRKFSRNGLAPDAQEMTFFQEEMNRLGRLRVKEIASFSCPLQSVPVAGGAAMPRIRWQCAFHSSPFARFIWVSFEMARVGQFDGVGALTIDASLDPYAKLLVEDSNGTDIGTVESHYGTYPGLQDTADTCYPSNLVSSIDVLNDGSSVVDIAGDTDYFCKITDEQSARIVSCNIWEVSAAADTDNGYIQSGVVVDSPVYDQQRAEVMEALRTQWKRGAAHLWNFASNTDATAPSTGSTSNRNVYDTSITAVSVASPGPTLDLAHRSTVRRVTVPVTMWVYARCTATTGEVKLKDSGGTTLATITVNSATKAWYSVTFNLPASSAKYDPTLRVATGIGSTFVYAISLYQHEA